MYLINTATFVSESLFSHAERFLEGKTVEPFSGCTIYKHLFV
jgi:hypothetical protein